MYTYLITSYNPAPAPAPSPSPSSRLPSAQSRRRRAFDAQLHCNSLPTMPQPSSLGCPSRRVAGHAAGRGVAVEKKRMSHLGAAESQSSGPSGAASKSAMIEVRDDQVEPPPACVLENVFVQARVAACAPNRQDKGILAMCQRVSRNLSGPYECHR